METVGVYGVYGVLGFMRFRVLGLRFWTLVNGKENENFHITGIYTYIHMGFI